MTDFTAPSFNEHDIERWRARIRVSTATNYLYCMGLALARTGEAVRAEQMFRQASEQDRAFDGARYETARLLRERGEDAQADSLDKAGIALNPDYILSAHLDRVRDLHFSNDLEPQALLPDIRRIIKEAVTPSIQSKGRAVLRDLLEFLAKKAVWQKDDATAILWLKEAASLAVEPMVPLLTTLAQTLRRQGNLAEAADVIHQAWLLLRDDASAEQEKTGLLAITILRLCLRLDEAIAICDALLARNSASVDLLIHKALLLIADRRPREAVTLLQTRISQRPDNSALHAYLSLALAASGDAEGAVAAGSRSVELDERNVMGLQVSGMALVLAGQAAKGVAMVVRGNALEPKASEWGYFSLAVACRMAGDMAAARDAVNKAMALPPPAGSGRQIGFLARLFPYAEDFMNRLYGEFV